MATLVESSPTPAASSNWWPSCETLSNCCDFGSLAGRVTQSWQMFTIMAAVVYCVVQAVAFLFSHALLAAIGSAGCALVLLYCASYIEQYQMVEALQQALDTANHQVEELASQVDRIGQATTTFETQNVKLSQGVERIEVMPTTIADRVEGVLRRVSAAFDGKVSEAFTVLTQAAIQTRAEQEKLVEVRMQMAALKAEFERTQQENDRVSKQLASNTQLLETAAHTLKARTDDAGEALSAAAGHIRSPQRPSFQSAPYSTFFRNNQHSHRHSAFSPPIETDLP